MAAQQALSEWSTRGQLLAAELSMSNQAIGAHTAMAKQITTDLAKAGKDAVRAQGEAFQKAN
jgi:hypothetical protein